MLRRSFTKTELQLNQLKHKQLPPQIDFAILQNNTITPVHYLIQHEEILHQKHNSHPIPADYRTDSGASLLVLNCPTFPPIANLLNITYNDKPNHTSKTLTVANRTEVPFLHYVTITFNTSIEQTSRQLKISFVVADIKYIIHDASFCEEYIQNINIQDFSLQFKHLINLPLCFQNTIHYTHTFTESIPEHKIPQKVHTFQ